MDYEVTAEAYLMRAINLLKNPQVSNYFYAALELRCCIERIPFEYLILLKHPDKLTKNESKKYKPGELHHSIKSIDPEFGEKLRFSKLYVEALVTGEKVRIPNFEHLEQCYGKLGSYLHAQKEPKDTVECDAWMVGFISFLNSVSQELRNSLAGPHAWVKLTLGNVTMDLYEKFKSGQFTEEQMKRMIKIAIPS